ncbi:DUF4244 domain-containing protein [Actinoplanes oblitus]|uniref:DUF4244 domain-containing protein n=1 Tax=Actinoplanes oblitus TaxID=3040509 RepID=A0ABY8WKC8_9ACTN|nr:DUF4244 domain-containing protein [Actinoplanes oblitus]WIM96809.1 DUF4244 domain-containing protein [Actinoplanes oblitus]
MVQLVAAFQRLRTGDGEAGVTSVEYAMVLGVAATIVGVLVLIMKSKAVLDALTDLVLKALR